MTLILGPDMEYFEMACRFRAKERWLIYYTNDQDGVVTDKESKILSFATPEAAAEFAKKKKWKIKQGQDPLDLDKIGGWVEKLDPKSLDCPALYRTWNLLGDVASSLGKASEFPGYESDAMLIHEELFWGCNLPGMAPADQPYIAKLSQEDAEVVQDVLASGLQMLLANLKEV